MTAITWGSIESRFFEAGVDRGVLYPQGGVGVAWNGLTSVTETPSGADVTSYYQDGVPYLNSRSSELFGGTIEAFTYPNEFAECDGTALTSYGFEISQQTRKSFGLCYRTRVGNAIEGLEHGYKLHLIYNATADPSERTYTTVGDSVEPNTFSWTFSTIPEQINGFLPSSHIILDSRKLGPELMGLIEVALYGTPTTNPRLLSVNELTELILEGFSLEIVDNGDGSWTAYGAEGEITFLSDTSFQISSPGLTNIDANTFSVRSLSEE